MKASDRMIAALNLIAHQLGRLADPPPGTDLSDAKELLDHFKIDTEAKGMTHEQWARRTRGDR